MIVRFYLWLSELFRTVTMVLVNWAEFSVIAARFFQNKAARRVLETQIMRIPE